ncbi:MAG: efflux RND transporter permease subunit [Gammaproteobacteria bacterium]|uniref:efflux RND transporter permease subunit n=1 Tax=Rhodoferax sp. TaxID=50421 RepID=UPI0017BE5DCB|nr:efflux RND transporter permease subunit [Rhodoferax sp.]MBU3900203.1 efflux RND transporter permease subunit [Gammaproteobacteria bacterium]MBA3058783.1 efflux RND transporter permease subunit [Rhodoferax sp.]MBU3999527.1 efflux RND transporter permease subunit [Gammaproteobacteria bacterium]MBU4082267.1 efflux RND transporter permease subunit [Gammaproteobacteria bacterium]MBU4113095.1 efflux RND transporter permease subunit [Gammaproteobacteria bacterium]
MKLTAYSVGQRLATAAIALALTVLGVYGLWRLPVNFLPDMTYPMVKVNIFWPGATPNEIERGLADTIERQLMTVDGLDTLESSSIEGLYSLIANFKYGADINTAYQDVTAAMARVARKLPKDIDPPIVFKADPTQTPILQLTVRSDRWDLVKLRTWTDEWLQDQILAVPGVAGTDIVGGLQREIRVHLKPAALDKYGLTAAIVARRLREENIMQFAGRLTVGPQEIVARTMGEFGSLDDLRHVVLLNQGGNKVLLSDVAEVLDSHREARVISRVNGQSAVKLSVLKQADANTVSVARDVQKRLDAIELTLPEGVQLGMLENQATYVVNALNGVQSAALEAAVLVVLIVWLFLGSWRQVVVIAVALPLILVLNFGVMKLAGFSLNIFSLGGLVVAIGVLVDNSILVVEAISRDREANPGAPINALVVKATSDIGPAVVASTLAFLALFVPFLIVPGLVSLLFRELILVVAGIVLISLAVALTLTPMLTALALGRQKEKAPGQGAGWFAALFDRATEGYGRLLAHLLNHRRMVLVAFVLAALAGGYGMTLLGSEFLPQMDDGRVMVKVKLPTGAALAETDRVLIDVEQQIKANKALSGSIESIFAMAGGKAVGTITNEIANEGELDLQLVPPDQRSLTTQAFIDQLRPVVAKVAAPGGKVTVSQIKIKGMRKLGDADIEVKLKGPDIEALFDQARQTAQAMTALKHFTNVYVAMDLSKPEYQVKIDRVRAAELGVTVAEVADTLRALVSGSVATRLRESGRDYDIRVMIPEARFANRSNLQDLRIPTSLGGFVQLRDLAQVLPATGPVEIVREDQIKTVIVRGDASGASVGQALSELQAVLDQSPPPPGYQRDYGGQAQMMGEMTQSAVMILAFSLFFSFIVLTVQFNSLKLPSLILASVPFCLAGMAGLLLVTGKPLGAPVVIGVLVVIAAVVNAGVLLFTYALLLQKTEQLSVRDAVLKAATIRLRPIVMVSMAILIGLLPLALALEAGGEMLQPMAIAAIGGLAMEMLVALFLMPCLYLMTNRDS